MESNCRKEPHPRAGGTEGRRQVIRTWKFRRVLGAGLQISEKRALPTAAGIPEVG